MSVKYHDYYATLGVPRTATPDEIRAAFRKLARQYHPDVNKDPAAADKFKEINEAYEVLGDEAKRKKFDQFGSNWKSGQDFQPGGQWEEVLRRAQQQHQRSGRRSSAGPSGFSFSTGPGGGGAGARGFSDFFEAFFGSGFDGFGEAESPARDPRQDVEADLEITLHEAIHGGTRRVTLSSEQGERRSIDVKVPPAVAPGDVIRLAGQGQGGGDLRLRVKIAPDSRARLEGRDLHMRVDVAPWEAALGAKIDLQAPTGQVTLNIPPGSTSGSKLRLRGRGLPQRSTTSPASSAAAGPGSPGAGDLFVELRIVVPPLQSDAQRDALARWKDAHADWSPR